MRREDFLKFEKAIGYLVANMESQPTLQDLASIIGMSESHCHRMFKKWVGVTPKDFLQSLTLTRAKKLLASSATLLDTSYDLGLSGTSRLHDLFVRYEAMTPGEYKRGGEDTIIYWDLLDTPLGQMVLGKTERGICSLFFSETSKRSALEKLRQKWPNAKFEMSSSKTESDKTEVLRRMSGQPGGELNLLVGGTPFQVKVWHALLSIPEGQVATYKKIAEGIGQPTAVRAVGTAIGTNPIGYLIPCHRVIRASGAVGDYHWGEERKVALLAIENSRANLRAE